MLTQGVGLLQISGEIKVGGNDLKLLIRTKANPQLSQAYISPSRIKEWERLIHDTLYNVCNNLKQREG